MAEGAEIEFGSGGLLCFDASWRGRGRVDGRGFDYLPQSPSRGHGESNPFEPLRIHFSVFLCGLCGELFGGLGRGDGAGLFVFAAEGQRG